MTHALFGKHNRHDSPHPLISGVEARQVEPTPSNPASRRRRRRLVVAGVQLLLLLASMEFGLHLLQRWNPDVRRLLYMPGVGTGFSECRDLPELLDQVCAGDRCASMTRERLRRQTLSVVA